MTYNFARLTLTSRYPWRGAVLACAIVCSTSCGQREPSTPAPARDADWQRVATWSGHGNAQLETFPITGWTWRVQWETKNESPAGSGTFKVTAHSGDSGRELAQIADVTGIDHDTTYVTELPHRYYLVVNSANVDWTLLVEEAVLK